MSEKKYWNSFYGNTKEFGLRIPSQFAVFIMNEYSGKLSKIVDLGCGNGRDAIFFAESGFKVFGVDASNEAIDLCRNINHPNAHFECFDVHSNDIESGISKWANDDIFILYARFFLHAITEIEEDKFFELARSQCIGDSAVAVEFRTNRDEGLNKVTGKHYRRYINPLDFIMKSAKYGFKPVYFTEGFGYAKYKSDDAHVARVILCRA